MNQKVVFAFCAIVATSSARPEDDYGEGDISCEYFEFNGGIAKDFSYNETVQRKYFDYM